MKDRIQQWLNGNRDAESGIKIIADISKEDAMHIKRLHYSDRIKKVFAYLLNIFRSGHSNAPAESQSNNIPKRAEHNPIHNKTDTNGNGINDPAASDVAAATAKKSADKLYKEMSNARAQLFSLCPQKPGRFENEGQSVAARERLAKEVIRLQYAVDEAYDAYRFACEHGRLPEKPKQEPDQQDMYRVIMNLRKSINKYKNSKKPLSPAQRERLQGKKTELEKLLKAYDN